MKVFCSKCMHYRGGFLYHYCKKTAKKVPVPSNDTHAHRAGELGYETQYGPAPWIKNMHNICQDYESNLSTYMKEKILSWVK